MIYELPTLNYEYNALEPVMDAETLEIHYSKHHQAYVNNLNAALAKHDIKQDNLVELLLNINDLPEDIQAAVRNNGGGHFNHSLFWNILTPEQDKQNGISPELESAIVKNFGSMDEFKAKFEDAGMKRFGSGWVWLVKTNSGDLKIVTLPNQDAPLAEGTPMLGVDLWEHSYYLKYQNKRAEYLKNIWSIVNWEQVSDYYQA